MKTVFKYLRLYRLDVAIISFFSYLISVLLIREISLKDFLTATLLSLVSFNFIYSFNSWVDQKIDEINKPFRPLPSKMVSNKGAFVYAVILLFFSLIYPFIISNTLVSLFLFLSLPILGILYSVSFFRVRRSILAQLVVISFIYMIPLLLGNYTSISYLGNQVFFLSLFIHSLALIPLKDIADIKGDKEFKYKNWCNFMGLKKLLLYSLFVLAINCCLILSFSIEVIEAISLLILNLATMVFIIMAYYKKLNINRLYRLLLIILIIWGQLLFLFLYIDKILDNSSRSDFNFLLKRIKAGFILWDFA